MVSVVQTPREPGALGAHEKVPSGRRPASGVDVARAAGVSQKTVSRVLNDDPHVRQDVRDRVRAAMAQLGYRPNRAARSLVLGRTRTIGLLSVGSTAFGPSALMVATERAVRGAGYALLLVNTFDDDADALSSGMSSLLDQGVDAVVINEPIGMLDVPAIRAEVGVPVLSLSGEYGFSSREIVVASDEVGGVRQAVDYLLAEGHSTVHHVAGPPTWYSSANRELAWRTALEDHGAPVPAVLVGDWSAGSGYAAGVVLAGDPDVSAVFVANDEMAIGMIRALQEYGRSVPGDISVIGFDDIPSAAYLSPALTTVRQNLAATASRGVDLLLETIDGLHEHGLTETVPADLVVRETTRRR